MKKRFKLMDNDRQLFKQTVVGVKPLLQDTVKPTIMRRNKKMLSQYRLIREQIDVGFYFSDEFQPLLQNTSPVCYIRSNVSSDEVKKLQRGDYTPELFLDLHGMTQAEAKKELGAMLEACQRRHIYCACVMHGYGKYILKQQTPLWLAQHPNIIGFYQAPQIFGGNASLLILVELML